MHVIDQVPSVYYDEYVDLVENFVELTEAQLEELFDACFHRWRADEWAIQELEELYGVNYHDLPTWFAHGINMNDVAENLADDYNANSDNTIAVGGNGYMYVGFAGEDNWAIKARAMFDNPGEDDDEDEA